MKRPFVFGLSSLALVSCLLPNAAYAQERIFYIDYEGGDDSADGKSQKTAWKHGPWDNASTGTAKKLAIQPGDQFRFKGGVRYRGTLLPRGTGTADKPIIFDGSSWGLTRAIFDGSTALKGVRPCQSAGDCLGSPHWANLWRADLPDNSVWSDWLFVNDLAYQAAQYPSVSRDNADDVNYFLTVPKADLAQLKAGQIKQALPDGLDKGEPVVAVWAYGNILSYGSGAQISKSGINLNNATWVNSTLNPYPDRDNKFAVLNAPVMVNRPGLFATSAKDRTVIFWPEVTAVGRPMNVSIGEARIAFNVNNLDHAVIRGFSFANYAARYKNYSSGTAILSNTNVDNLTIADNLFISIMNVANRMGAIHLTGATNLTIKRNTLQLLPATSAIVIDRSSGPTEIRCNKMTTVGRTGIRFNDVAIGNVKGNMISGLNGIHGNGISVYNDLRDILIEGNVVVNSERPLTMHGTDTPYFAKGRPAVTVRQNVLISNHPSDAAIASYGTTPNLTISDNFLAAQKFAIRLRGTETGLVVTNNSIVGGVNIANGAKIYDPEQNITHSYEGNGKLLMAEKSTSSTPSKAYCL